MGDAGMQNAALAIWQDQLKKGSRLLKSGRLPQVELFYYYIIRLEVPLIPTGLYVFGK